MKFKLEIDLNNSAFEDTPEIELSRILKRISESIEAEGLPYYFQTVRDINGNNCGSFAAKPLDYWKK